ncbi:MAG: hypothetical protein FD123_4160 [Bacteroidetes bacterium]|nr:MAG: hypothetical protein FD123_4160 [Bacteroidota bacterium]
MKSASGHKQKNFQASAQRNCTNAGVCYPPTAQLKSQIFYKTKPHYFDNQKQSVTAGQQTIAYLDPNDPINGSAPGTGEQKDLMTYLKDKKDFRSMKRGHLMNGQLGGPGIAQNLFPITSQANSNHKFCAENHIKKAIDDDIGVMYIVSVNAEYDADGKMNGAADFKCTATVWDPSGNVIDLDSAEPFSEVSIESRPEAGTTGTGQVTGKYKAPEKISFLTRDLPKGWGEKGKGLENWDDKIPGHFQSM